MSEQKSLIIGRVSGAFGVKGWIKIFSFTDPIENILSYSPWMLTKGGEIKNVSVITGRLQGRSVIAQLEGLQDRDEAAALSGWDVSILKNRLPEPKSGEYYWSDLIGLKVENLQGVGFGVVDGLMETGANDVLMVSGDRQRAVPFLQGRTIVDIDLTQGRIIVDWDSEF